MIVSAQIIDSEPGQDITHLAVTCNILSTDRTIPGWDCGPKTFQIDATSASMNAAILAAVVAFWNGGMPSTITAADVRLSGVFNT